MNCSFPKSLRVRTRRQYQRIAQRPTRHIGQWVIVDVCQSHHSTIKLGITASRRYGIAVERNRFKRIVREAFRVCRSHLQTGVDINVKPRTQAKEAKSGDVLAELLAFLKQSPVQTAQ